MIDYDPGRWGIGFVFQLRGSVIPKTLLFAAPCGALAVLVHFLRTDYLDSGFGDFEIIADNGISIGVHGFTSVLGFMLVFRTQKAYGRWWEGGTLLQTVRGEWFNAYSNLIAFCTRSAEKRHDVEKFQHLLVRLMSLLYCSALQQVSTMENSVFEILHVNGMQQEHMEFLHRSDDKVEVILQWIQRLTVDGMEQGILPIPPPILSRVFQELSRGVVNLQNAKKISEFPFPFPYAQMLSVMLFIHWLTMPILMGLLCEDAWWAGTLTLVTEAALWCIHYTAQEIENPFGDDENDLPLKELQIVFNENLVTLLMREVQQPPRFDFDAKEHRNMATSYFDSNLTPVSDLLFPCEHLRQRTLARTPTADSDLSSATLGGKKPVLAHGLSGASSGEDATSPRRRRGKKRKRPSIFKRRQEDGSRTSADSTRSTPSARDPSNRNVPEGSLWTPSASCDTGASSAGVYNRHGNPGASLTAASCSMSTSEKKSLRPAMREAPPNPLAPGPRSHFDRPPEDSGQAEVHAV